MHCPQCNRDVAPRTGIDWDAAFTKMGIQMFIALAVVAIFTLGIGLVICLSVLGFLRGTYKVCPICRTPLTKPDGGEIKDDASE